MQSHIFQLIFHLLLWHAMWIQVGWVLIASQSHGLFGAQLKLIDCEIGNKFVGKLSIKNLGLPFRRNNQRLSVYVCDTEKQILNIKKVPSGKSTDNSVMPLSSSLMGFYIS